MKVSKPEKGYKLVDAGFGKFDEIPEKWDFEKLGSVVTIEMGQAPLGNSYNKEGKGTLLVKAGEFGNTYPIENVWTTKPLKFSTKNDVLLCVVGATIGKTNLGIDCAIGRSVAALKPNSERISQKFLYLFLMKQIEYLRSSIQGSAQGVITTGDIKNLDIPLPNTTEQNKITSILSNVDNTLQKTNQLIQKTELLKKGMMQKLFTKGIGHTKFKKIDWYYKKQIQIPEEWEIKKLEEVAKITRGKFGHRPRNDPDYYGGKHPFIQTGDVENAQGVITDYSQTLNEKGLRTSKYFPINTIVITIAANIGATAITTFPVCFPDSLIGITSKSMNIKFLEYYLRTLKKYLENVAHVSAQKNINYQNLKPLLIPVPLLSEQKQIASILSNIDSQITKEKLQKSNLELLKKGLMQKLLTGQIRVKV